MLIDLDLGQVEPGEFRQPTAGVQHGVVLDAARDQVAFTVQRGCLGDALDGQVGALAA